MPFACLKTEVPMGKNFWQQVIGYSVTNLEGKYTVKLEGNLKLCDATPTPSLRHFKKEY